MSNPPSKQPGHLDNVYMFHSIGKITDEVSESET